MKWVSSYSKTSVLVRRMCFKKVDLGASPAFSSSTANSDGVSLSATISVSFSAAGLGFLPGFLGERMLFDSAGLTCLTGLFGFFGSTGCSGTDVAPGLNRLRSFLLGIVPLDVVENVVELGSNVAIGIPGQRICLHDLPDGALLFKNSVKHP